MNLNKNDLNQNCTTIPLKKEIESKKWYLFDMKDKFFSDVSSDIIKILRGKNKTIFFPNLDIGDFVVLENVKFMLFSGNKLEKNKRYNHSGYPGGLRERTWKYIFNKNPEELIYLIIKGMMPNNKIGRKQMKRLFIYQKEQLLKAQEKNFIKIK